MSKKFYFQNRCWKSSCIELSVIQMSIWLNKGMNIGSFPCRSQAPPVRLGLFHSPELTGQDRIYRTGMSRDREISATILPVKPCSRNSCTAIQNQCWRWSSTEHFAACLQRAFLGTARLNEADIPPSRLCRLWHRPGRNFSERFELVIFLESTVCQCRKHAIIS